MTANQYISLALLVGRLISVSIVLTVVKKQRRVLKSKNYPELRPIRVRNLVGSYTLIGMSLVPIILDTLGVFDRATFGLLLLYVASNNLSAILYSYMLWSNLRLAERIVISDR